VPYIQHILGDFLQYFNSNTKINNVRRAIKEAKTIETYLGENDHSIKLTKDNVEFDLLFDKEDFQFGEHYPLKLNIATFNDLLCEIETFLSKYNNCKLPGIIPPDKYSEFSVVPNNYIKQSFFEEQKNSFNNTLDSIDYDERRELAYNLFRTSPLLKIELDQLFVQRKISAEIELSILRKSLNEIIATKKYTGGLNARFNSSLIRFKLEEYNLPESLTYFTYEKFDYKNFELEEIDSLFQFWKNELENEKQIELELAKIGINQNQNDYKELFKRYPNLYIRLKELIKIHTGNLVREIIREQIISKKNSVGSSEKLIIWRSVANIYTNKYQLGVKEKEELTEWLVRNNWTERSIEEYINGLQKK